MSKNDRAERINKIKAGIALTAPGVVPEVNAIQIISYYAGWDDCARIVLAALTGLGLNPVQIGDLSEILLSGAEQADHDGGDPVSEAVNERR